MTVWQIVEEEPYEGEFVHGTFTTAEKAAYYLNRMAESFERRWPGARFKHRYYEIKEIELDPEWDE